MTAPWFTRRRVRVTLDSTISVLGYARRYGQGSDWKWNTSATISESTPAVRGWDPTLNDWVGVGLTFEEDPENPGTYFDQTAFGVASDPAGNNQVGGLGDGTSPFSPGANNQNGKIRARGFTSISWTTLEAKVTWISTGGPSEALNCQVLTEELRLAFSFRSYAF